MSSINAIVLGLFAVLGGFFIGCFMYSFWFTVKVTSMHNELKEIKILCKELKNSIEYCDKEGKDYFLVKFDFTCNGCKYRYDNMIEYLTDMRDRTCEVLKNFEKLKEISGSIFDDLEEFQEIIDKCDGLIKMINQMADYITK